MSTIASTSSTRSGPRGASPCTSAVMVSATARQSTVVRAIRLQVGQRESMIRGYLRVRAITRRWISFVPS